jgi:PAS domain S-box-containing protein
VYRDLVSNVALLVALSATYNLLERLRFPQDWVKRVLGGVLFGFVTVVGMQLPFRYGPGLIFDGRSIILSLAGLFGGPVTGAVAAAMAAAYRFHLGGVGAWTGIGVIATSALAGIVWHRRMKGRPEEVGAGSLFFLGLAVHVLMLLWMLTLPWPMGLGVLKRIGLPVLLIYPPATVLLGQLLAMEARRRRSEEALRRNMELLQKTQSIARIGSWEYDVESRRLTWSPEVSRLFGVDPDIPPSYELFLQCVHPDDRERVDRAYMESVRQGKDGYEIEHRIVRPKDGRIRTVFEKCEHIRGTDGRIVRSVGFVQDVTERRAAEEELRERESTLLSIFRAAPVGIGMVKNRVIHEANEQLCRMAGYSRHELLGRSARILYPSDEEFEFVGREKYRQIAQKGTGTVETRWRRKDGRILEVLLSSCPIDPQDPSHGVTFTALDITERIRAERALRESEEKFAKAFRSAPLLMSITRLEDALVLDVNDTYCEVTGYGREEMIGRTTLEIGLWRDPTDRRRLLKQLRTRGRVTNLDLDLRMKNGEIRHMLFSCEPVVLQGTQCLISVGMDITERVRADQALKELAAELELRVAQRTAQLTEANKELEAFIFSVSHDLRAPLRAISGFAEIIARRHREALNEEGRRYFDHILEASERMGDLISDLLNYSRLGRKAVTPEVIELEPFVEEVLRPYEETLRSGETELVLDLEVSSLWADRALLRQIVSNLVDNALKYRREDVEHRVRIACRTEGSEAVLTVSDNGIGIDPNHHERIFNIFQRLHPRTAYPGTGIGLALVKKAVSLLGGTIRLASEPEKGTEFEIRWPAQAKENRE